MNSILKVALGLIVITAQTCAQTPNLPARCNKFSFAFFANSSDCGKFVFCEEGSPVGYQCMSDEIWSQDDAACVLGNQETCEPWNVQKACVGLEDGSILHPRNCDRFIICSNEQAEEVVCQPGFVFLETNASCVIGSSIQCESLEYLCSDNKTPASFPHPDYCDAFINCNENYSTVEFCPVNEIFRSDIEFCVPGNPEICEVAQLDTICINRPSSTVPHPQNCTKFVVCSGDCTESNCATQELCGRGEVFNPRISSCVVGNEESCELLDDICIQQQNGRRFGVPLHCDLFIECSNNSAILHSCSSGKILRLDMQYCVPGDNESCEFTILEEMCTDLPYGTIFPHPYDCDKYIMCDINETVEVPCPEDTIVEPGSIECVPGDRNTCLFYEDFCQNNDDGMYPHPNECNSFIFCQNNQSLIQLCPPGDVFEITEQKCVPGNMVTCTPLNCTDQNDGVSAHPNLCNIFIRCDDVQISSQLCYRDHIFHPALLVCTPGNISNCDFYPVEEMCIDRFDGTRYPYPELDGCTQYVVCSNGQGYAFSCPEGTVLRPQDLECVVGNDDTCEYFDIICSPDHDDVLIHPSRCDIKIVCSTGQHILEFCPSGQIFDPETFQCVPGDINNCFPPENFCESRPDGEYAHPNDCSRFIRCISGETNELVCSEDEIYRAEVSFCVPGNPTNCENFPLEIMCADRVNGQQYPHPNNCDKFIVCQDEQPLVQSCDRGMVIQAGTIECVVGNANTCELYLHLCVEQTVETIAHPADCDLFISCQSTNITVEACSRGEIFDPENLMCSAGNIEDCELLNLCSEGIDGAVFPYPEYCGLFIQCEGNIDTVKQCPTGEIFDQTKTECAPGDVETCELAPEKNFQ
ncbi:uncharacterized protein LOC131439033 [Malaya genurostris]|uniref:uncharacterized protein LOC131439033 n=1 Tax=Malaya genurostris TaxID=325434 RepID=UPI0026F3B18F|nr:uncharacterized protein LOC131439033 [Malaya genurostris]